MSVRTILRCDIESPLTKLQSFIFVSHNLSLKASAGWKAHADTKYFIKLYLCFTMPYCNPFFYTCSVLLFSLLIESSTSEFRKLSAFFQRVRGFFRETLITFFSTSFVIFRTVMVIIILLFSLTQQIYCTGKHQKCNSVNKT